MIIDKDFDQLKKILEDPDRANKLVAYNSFTGSLIITEATDSSIIAKYCTGKFCYDISFFKRNSNGMKRIEYQFNATKPNYLWMFFWLPILLYKHEDFGGWLGVIQTIILFGGFWLLVLYLIKEEVRKGIYNRIHNRWDDVSL